ncbi:transmembrane protein 50 [Tanacetum coccineum]
MDLAELWAIFGPGVAGAVFGSGWWFWVDAVVCSSVKVSFLHYLPGIFASLAALMFNCVRREDIDYSPYEEGEWSTMMCAQGTILAIQQCNILFESSGQHGNEPELKLWLFLAYVVSFVSLAASVGLLIQDALLPEGPSAWTGTAGVLQCVLVLISGLVYWTSHSE